MILTAFQNPQVQCDSVKGETLYFWTGLLNGNVVDWTALGSVQKLIRLVLALPVGSSEAERGFSILNQIRTKRRSQYTAETLEGIMRIRLNGPPQESWDAEKYVKSWLAEGHWRADDPRRRGRIAKPKLDTDYGSSHTDLENR